MFCVCTSKTRLKSGSVTVGRLYRAPQKRAGGTQGHPTRVLGYYMNRFPLQSAVYFASFLFSLALVLYPVLSLLCIMSRKKGSKVKRHNLST